MGTAGRFQFGVQKDLTGEVTFLSLRVSLFVCLFVCVPGCLPACSCPLRMACPSKPTTQSLNLCHSTTPLQHEFIG